MNENKERFWVIQLALEFHSITSYYGLPISLPLIQITSNQRQYGSWDPLTRTLSMSRVLIEKESWDVVLEIFKHEIAHMLSYDHADTREETAHGNGFQDACVRLGVAPWARQAIAEIDTNTARSQHRNLSEDKERQIRRIEKLLSLAKSSNPNEAALAMEMARSISNQYQIDMASEQRNYSYAVINHKRKRMPAQHASIASILCSHFHVDCVSRPLFDANDMNTYQVLEILGSIENVQIAEYVYWYLWNELPSLWSSYLKESKASTKRASQKSFYLGVLNGFSKKLSLEKEPAEATSGLASSASGLVKMSESLEIILKKELDNFVAERFPRLRRGGSRRGFFEAEAYNSGVTRGGSLDINKGISTGEKALALKSGSR